MPEPLTESEITSQTDPSVSKQYDNDASSEVKFKDFYTIVDGIGVCMMGTFRQGVGPLSRAMAVSKRTGPDFLFLANNHSRKFSDLDKHKQTTLAFHDSSKQDWASITGEATVISNSDPRIKEIWSRAASIWFGDLGDGTHTGGPEDPRLTLIEVKPKHISYWKRTTGTLGFAKEAVGAMVTGGVANTGVIREMGTQEIQQARQRDSSMSS